MTPITIVVHVKSRSNTQKMSAHLRCVHKIEAYIRKKSRDIVNKLNLNVNMDIYDPKLHCRMCNKYYETKAAYLTHLKKAHFVSFINEALAKHKGTTPFVDDLNLQ